MDTAATILLQAATLIGGAALDEASKQAVGDAWNAARAAIKRKFGSSNQASALLENAPGAAGNDNQLATIQAQLATLQLGRDAEVLKAIEDLAAAMRRAKMDANAPMAQIIYGAGIVQGSQTNYFR